MKLNRLEKAMMNNPIRRAIQKYFEAPRLLQMGNKMNGGIALEIGCGQGVGIELILDLFGADRVDAFDIDPAMVDLAYERLKRRENQIQLWVGDATAIQADDNSYDAIFDFGIIHHIPAWENSLREIWRVLKPGGRFYAEEVLDKFILSPIWRRLLDHPLENRFDHDRFCQALSNLDFKLVNSRQLWGRFSWFVAEKDYFMPKLVEDDNSTLPIRRHQLKLPEPTKR
jgi:ubiquinone/menaquinone biosynthesis C-methylase UbiE